MSTRRLGKEGELTNFSLHHKQELNRNIPFTKFRNMDFSGMQQNRMASPSKVGRPLAARCPKLILRKESL